MMNVIAITLMLASMASAGIWSPAPDAAGKNQVITKEGHRAVVVEYADDTGQGNTKVSISPPLTSPSLEEQLSSATAAVAGVAQDARKAATGTDGHGWGARDLICDAFGKCTDKISGTVYKAKDKVSDTAHEMEEGARETVTSVVDKAKEVSSKAQNAAEQGADKAKRGVSRAKESAEHTIEKAGEAAENAKKKGKEKTKEMSEIAKRAKEVLNDAVSCLIPNEFFTSLMRLVHLLGFATSYGTATWVTFAMSHLLARSLPRQQFGVVQSRVYPVYFKALASSIGLALLGHLLGRPNGSSVTWRLQVYNLLTSVGLVLVNLHVLEPRATKVMYERMKIEKEEGRGVNVQSTRVVDHVDSPLTNAAAATTASAVRREEGGETKGKMERLNRRLKKINSYSSLLNVMSLVGLTWHLVYLSQRMCV